MEVSNELQQLLTGKTNIQTICEDLESQQKELNRKMYFFRALDMIEQVSELIENKVFETHYIEYVKIFLSYQEDIGPKIYIKFYDREDEDISSYVNKDIHKLESFMSKFNGLNLEDTGLEFNNAYGFLTIALNKKYKENFINALFSRELKIIIEKTMNYVQLEQEIGESSKDIPKKMKV
jgi:hypothetical protein